MSNESRFLIIGFLIGFVFTCLTIAAFSDSLNSNAVNMYLRGELKCEPKPFTENELTCITVGKD